MRVAIPPRGWNICKPDEEPDIIALAAGTTIAVILFGSHLFVGHNRFEIARRVACHANMLDISSELEMRGIQLSAGHEQDVQRVLAELDLRCPSAVQFGGDGLYVAIIRPSGELWITEDEMNHHPDRFVRTDKPAIQHTLRGYGEVVQTEVARRQ